jgi:putative solute:sodium symporter small subunit
MANNQNTRVKTSHSSWYFSCWWVVFLSVIALVCTLLPLIFAQNLATHMLFGWPTSFLIVAFGLPLLYLLIIAFYAWVMDVRERTK